MKNPSPCSHPIATPSLSRRRFMQGMGAALAAGASSSLLADGPRQDVVVLTSYPDAVVSRFEAAFERAHPEYRLRVVWRMPHDMPALLAEPGQGGVDVVWTASPRLFAQLAAEGALQPLGIPLEGLPERVGGCPLRDEGRMYIATELAGYGFAVNPAYLAARGLRAPADWVDLADPVYADHLVLPDPQQVGFAPLMLDIPLQAYGWEAGWALWSAIVGNGRLLGRGGTSIADEVGAGRSGVGLSMDFFVAAARANGAPLDFVYPRQGGLNPGHGAVTASAPHPEGARALMSLLLSAPGQALLLHPDIRKLPVRPAVYGGSGVPSPFAQAGQGGYRFETLRGQARAPLLSAAFAQALGRPAVRLQQLWRALHQADGAVWMSVAPLLGAAPFKAGDAEDPVLQQVFAERRQSARHEQQAQAWEQDWAARVNARLAQAAALLGVPA